MHKFLFAYHGGKRFETRDEGMAYKAKWTAWSEGLGDAVTDPVMPIGASKTVSSDGVADGGGSNPLSGIMILSADSMEAVLQLAKTCPHLEIGGSIEVAEIMQM